LNLKYKTTENTFGNFIITSLIKKRRGSYNLNFKELNILNDENEYFKRFYNINDSYFRIPKYYEYYKNYLLYFCKPFIRGKGVNKILLKHMEKAAEEFYKNNFDEEKINENIEKNNNKRIKIRTIQPKIFSNNVIEEIENERLETNKISNIENEEKKFLKIESEQVEKYNKVFTKYKSMLNKYNIYENDEIENEQNEKLSNKLTFENNVEKENLKMKIYEAKLHNEILQKNLETLNNKINLLSCNNEFNYKKDKFNPKSKRMSTTSTGLYSFKNTNTLASQSVSGKKI
jgi:hypothetical protein